MESNWQKGVDAFAAGRKDEALALLQLAVQENPTDAEARKYFGAILAQSGRAAEAVTQLRQAVQLSPQNAQIHYNLGVAQQMNGDTEGAKASYYSALQINPAYDQARTALSQMGATLPPMPAAAPSAPVPSSPTVNASQPFNDAGALTTHGPPTIVQPLGGADYFKAILFGGIAALVGAFIWDKFVYYTRIEFALISVGIGVLVGIAVMTATGGRSNAILQVISGLLALWGMLLGNALLEVDFIRQQAASIPQLANISSFSLLILALQDLPSAFKEDPLSLAFVAFGAYEGWKIPGNSKEAPPAPVAATTAYSQTPQPPQDPPKPLN